MSSPSALATVLRSLQREKVVRPSVLTASFLIPQLATLSEELPSASGWIFENKYDGYRILAIKRRRKVTLYSRNGKDWTHRFRELADRVAKLAVDTCVLDGEVIVGKNGASSFSALQQRLSAEKVDGFTYYTFDITYLEGLDLRRLPLIARKALLQSVLRGNTGARSPLRLSPFTVDDGKEQFAHACGLQREGIIAKLAQAPYVGKRAPSWLKIKCHLEDEFVICGYTDPAGSRQHLGALLVGYFQDGDLVYAGRVGTGFDRDTLAMLATRLPEIPASTSPVTRQLTTPERKGAHFVKPKLVAQISYTEWTPDGRLRHPVFLGLREDKAAAEVISPRATILPKKKGSYGKGNLVRQH